MNAAGDAEREQHAAAAEVADQVERRHRRLARPADGVQDARDRDVIDIVTRARRQRPGLAPAGHAAIHELRIAREHGVWPQAQALHDAGPEPFDQRIGFFGERESRVDPALRLEIKRNRAPAAQHDVVPPVAPEAEARIARAVDQQDVGAHVGQHHAAERARPDGLEFKLRAHTRRKVPSCAK